MMKNKSYHPVLYKRMTVFFDTADWDALCAFFDSLSHSEFRTCGNMLSTHFLPDLSEDDFWGVFGALSRYNSKAFLVTMLKAIPERVKNGVFFLRHEGLAAIAEEWNRLHQDVDRRKTLQCLLPLMEGPDDASYLLSLFQVERPLDQLDLLLRCEITPVCGYLLFQVLRKLEHDTEMLMRCATFLMKRGDGFSFNLACFLKVYFDLSRLKGTFSLKLDPYQLGRMESNFDVFKSVLCSM